MRLLERLNVVLHEAVQHGLKLVGVPVLALILELLFRPQLDNDVEGFCHHLALLIFTGIYAKEAKIAWIDAGAGSRRSAGLGPDHEGRRSGTPNSTGW